MITPSVDTSSMVSPVNIELVTPYTSSNTPSPSISVSLFSCTPNITEVGVNSGVNPSLSTGISPKQQQQLEDMQKQLDKVKQENIEKLNEQIQQNEHEKH